MERYPKDIKLKKSKLKNSMKNMVYFYKVMTILSRYMH